MQINAYENWIDSITERDFDVPFLLLLRTHGFFDIHFTHGSFEFGKDFIAKRKEDGVCKQYGFQSKAGDISGANWDAIHGQLIELLGTWLVHPNYDTTLLREHRLVLTGTLKGKAILSAKQFAEKTTSRNEGHFQVWDKQNLLDLLDGKNPGFSLPNMPTSIDRLIGSLESENHSIYSIIKECESAFSIPVSISGLRETATHLSILENELWLSGRKFHAYRVRQHILRLGFAFYLDSNSIEALEECRIFLDAVIQLGFEIIDSLIGLEPIAIADLCSMSIGKWASYPNACIINAEILSFVTIYNFKIGEDGKGKSNATKLCNFIADQPGCCHPLSDRSAPSIMSTIFALVSIGEHTLAESLVKRTTKWVCDQIEGAFGLSSPYADVGDEVKRFFGSPFDFIEIFPRRESQMAVALLDASYVFFPGLYPEIANEFAAVGAIPSTIHPFDTGKAMFASLGEAQTLINLQYPFDVESASLKHHLLQSEPRRIEQLLGPLVPLMMACLCGDRLFSDVLPRALSKT